MVMVLPTINEQQPENTKKSQSSSLILQEVNQLSVSDNSTTTTKSSMSLILELMKKVEYLEKQLKVLSAGENASIIRSQTPVQADFKPGNYTYSECQLSDEDKRENPECEKRITWILRNYRSDTCYASYGVDGSLCSARIYLSEVEAFCPPLLSRENVWNKIKVKPRPGKARVNVNLEGLLNILVNPGKRTNYDWIRKRITSKWPSWVSAAKSLQNRLRVDRGKKVILLYVGFISTKAKTHMLEAVGRGGSLGEFVQWSDVIASYYILGHEVKVFSEYEQLSKEFASAQVKEKSMCQPRSVVPSVDMIVTDLIGYTHFMTLYGPKISKFRCLFRVLDSFGTEAAFNFKSFAMKTKQKTYWGMKNLDLRQFFTLFPHSPDNSFMGFAIQMFPSKANTTRKNQAVIYGKSEDMWERKEPYLNIIREFAEIHGTVYVKNQSNTSVPKYVHNHGNIQPIKLHNLLQESKLFIGLGFPYEGPAPLEAIANGNVFINPKFNPPHSSLNTKFFKGKPTKRSVTSQLPYAEEFIGEPYVRTIDVSNENTLRDTIRQAINDVDSGKMKALLPREFTHEGMLERLNAYTNHQDFCSENATKWPPEQDIRFVLSKQGQSCRAACLARKMICENSYFNTINSKEKLQQYVGKKCNSMSKITDEFYPAYNVTTGGCILQEEPLMFSCVGQHPSLLRMCPCRTYFKYQTGICQICL